MEGIRRNPTVGRHVGHSVESTRDRDDDRGGEVVDVEVLHRRVAVRSHPNAGRVEHEPEIDAVIEEWTGLLDSVTALALLEEARVPSGPIFNVADMMENEHFKARGLFEEVDVNGRKLKIPAMVPKLSNTPGRTDWAGPEVGAFNQEIYSELLGLSDEEMAILAKKGVL